MPPYGVGLVTSMTDYGEGLTFAVVTDSTSSSVIGMLVNGPSSVASGCYGAGSMGVGPVPCYYDSANTPAVGETWGPKSGGTAFKIYKGYMGFITTAKTGGTSSYPRVMAHPAFEYPMRIVCARMASSLTMTYSASTEIIPVNLQGFGTNGVWPFNAAPLSIEYDTPSTGRMTVRRSGLWRISACWSSTGPPRFSAPYQSKVHRVGVSLYKNGSWETGIQSDYYHFSLANADSSPTAGVAIPQNGSIEAARYLATGDIIDLRLTVSEVTADSGTTTEGDVTFIKIHFMAEYIGAQIWRNDY